MANKNISGTVAINGKPVPVIYDSSDTKTSSAVTELHLYVDDNGYLHIDTTKEGK